MTAPEPSSPEFGFAHHAYRRFRPAYPESLYERIFALAPGRELAVDLGAGTGLVSAVLARHFARVIAIEPDSAMAAHLHETAPTVERLAAPAERAELPPGCAELISCANAFHWMDGSLVAGQIATWLRPGGIFAGWRYPFPTLPGALQELVASEMQQRWAPYRDPRIADMTSMQRRLGARPELELIIDEQVPNPVMMDIHALLGFLRSTSFGSAYLRTLDPDAAERYLAGLAAELAERMPEPELRVELDLTFVVARRRSDR